MAYKLVFLGIDGSGKSTHSTHIKEYLENRGIKTGIVHFHKYLIVDRFAKMKQKTENKKTTKQKIRTPILPENPKSLKSTIRCYLASIDNLLMYLWSLIKYRNYDCIIYDRFPWATYIKYKGLGYNVDPVKKIFFLPQVDFGFVFDIDFSTSEKRVLSRGHETSYPRECIELERKYYLDIAKERGFPVLDTKRDFETNQRKIKKILEKKIIKEKRRHKK